MKKTLINIKNKLKNTIKAIKVMRCWVNDVYKEVNIVTEKDLRNLQAKTKERGLYCGCKESKTVYYECTNCKETRTLGL